jgi:hypothetical protein
MFHQGSAYRDSRNGRELGRRPGFMNYGAQTLQLSRRVPWNPRSTEIIDQIEVRLGDIKHLAQRFNYFGLDTLRRGSLR